MSFDSGKIRNGCLAGCGWTVLFGWTVLNHNLSKWTLICTICQREREGVRGTESGSTSHLRIHYTLQSCNATYITDLFIYIHMDHFSLIMLSNGLALIDFHGMEGDRISTHTQTHSYSCCFFCFVLFWFLFFFLSSISSHFCFLPFVVILWQNKQKQPNRPDIFALIEHARFF